MSAMTAGGTGWQEVARAARAAPPPLRPPQGEDLLLDGLAASATEGHQVGLPALSRALRVLAEEPSATPAVTEVSILWLACRTAMNLWDDESFVQIADRLVDSARRTGAAVESPGAFGMAATAALLTGDFTAAASFIDQTDAMITVIGTVQAPHGRLALAAWQGRTDAEADPAANLRAASLGIHAYTAALLYNGLGRYEEALEAALGGSEIAGQLGYSLWALPELAEAASRCGRLDLAEQAVAQLAETTTAAGTEWGLGTLARSRALTRVRSACGPRARRDRRADPQAGYRAPCGTDTAGGADRPAGQRRPVEPPDRGAAFHQPPHR